MDDLNLKRLISGYEALQKAFELIKKTVLELVTKIKQLLFVGEVKLKTLNKIQTTRKKNPNGIHFVRSYPLHGGRRRDHRRQHR